MDTAFGNGDTEFQIGDRFLNPDFTSPLSLDPGDINNNWSTVDFEESVFMEAVRISDVFPETLDRFGAIEGIGENFDGVDLSTADATEIQPGHNFENNQILNMEFRPGACNVPVKRERQVTPETILGNLNLSDEGSESDTQTPLEIKQTQTPDSSSSGDALYIDTDPETTPGQSASDQDTRIRAAHAVIKLEKYFCLPDLDLCELVAHPEATASAARKPSASMPRSAKRPRSAAAMMTTDVQATRLGNPSKDELREFATFPGEDCFDPAEKLNQARFRLITQLEWQKKKLNVEKREERTGNKRVQLQRKFRVCKRVQWNQLILHNAYLELLHDDLEQRLVNMKSANKLRRRSA